MPIPRVLILRSPGTNCDVETAHAFERAGAATEAAHINQLIEAPGRLAEFQIFCVPGGFSYGDDIAAGRVLGAQLRGRLAEACQSFREAGKLVLGICNGFQVIIQTGLLDLEDQQGQMATLTWNDHGRYEARWVELTASPGECVFLQGIDQIELPIAHAEGKIAVRDAQTLEQLSKSGRVVLRYGSNGDPSIQPLPFPQNPNGSAGNAAGLCDATGRVLGLMPHPERFLQATQHPSWTRRPNPNSPGDGLKLFENAVRYFA